MDGLEMLAQDRPALGLSLLEGSAYAVDLSLWLALHVALGPQPA